MTPELDAEVAAIYATATATASAWRRRSRRSRRCRRRTRTSRSSSTRSPGPTLPATLGRHTAFAARRNRRAWAHRGGRGAGSAAVPARARHGLDGDALRRCLVQYGSTLRNLERYDESLALLDRAEREFPGSASVAMTRALTLLEQGRPDAAVGTLLLLRAADPPGDMARYAAAARGNGEYLLGRDRRV